MTSSNSDGQQDQSPRTGDPTIDDVLKILGGREGWQYFEDRANRISEQLWNVGTWLLGITSAILALPFASKMIAVDGVEFFEIKAKTPVTAISIFGILFCVCAFIVWLDMYEHMEKNFAKANKVKECSTAGTPPTIITANESNIVYRFGNFALIRTDERVNKDNQGQRLSKKHVVPIMLLLQGIAFLLLVVFTWC